jgi:excisionase family DNA binding protein
MSLVPAPVSPRDVELLRRIAQRPRQARLRLVVDDDEPVDLPEALTTAVGEIAGLLARGRAVVIAPQSTILTTGEAAEILGVSRPTVVKLMEDGALPFSRPNSSRRIALADVLAYKEERSRRRRAALAELTADLAEAGLYDEDVR